MGFRSTGYFAVSLARLHGVRWEARKGGPLHRRSTACRFTFSTAQFWQLSGGEHEFWHEGRLYDVESMQQQGDSLHIVARPDDPERSLLAGLKTIFQRSGPTAPGTPLASWWAQFLTQPFLPPAPLTRCCAFLWEADQQTDFPPCLLPASQIPGVLKPPPKC